jgi:hypothetical protein
MLLSTLGLSGLAVPTASWLGVRFWLSIRPPQTSTPTTAAIRAKLLEKCLGFGAGELRYQYSFCIASGSTNGYKRGIAGAPPFRMSSDEQERWCSRTVHFADTLAGKLAEGVGLFTLWRLVVCWSVRDAGSSQHCCPSMSDRTGVMADPIRFCVRYPAPGRASALGEAVIQ